MGFVAHDKKKAELEWRPRLGGLTQQEGSRASACVFPTQSSAASEFRSESSWTPVRDHGGGEEPPQAQADAAAAASRVAAPPPQRGPQHRSPDPRLGFHSSILSWIYLPFHTAMMLMVESGASADVQREEKKVEKSIREAAKRNEITVPTRPTITARTKAMTGNNHAGISIISISFTLSVGKATLANWFKKIEEYCLTIHTF